MEKETSELSHGPMRSCKVTDAYGNMVIFSAEGLVEDTALMHETSKVKESPCMSISASNYLQFKSLSVMYFPFADDIC